jgi:hypothetical protein
MPIRGGRDQKPPFEMLAESRDVAVADAVGDASYRQTSGTKQFGRLFHP